MFYLLIENISWCQRSNGCGDHQNYGNNTYGIYNSIVKEEQLKFIK